MRFHDYKLQSYSVLDSGAQIVFELVYDYPGVEKRYSRISFSEVACYSFKHTAGAIINDIEEIELDRLVREESKLLESFAREHGLTYWETDTAQYLAALRSRKMRAWRIDSAIGFSGFVIGRDVEGTP